MRLRTPLSTWRGLHFWSGSDRRVFKWSLREGCPIALPIRPGRMGLSRTCTCKMKPLLHWLRRRSFKIVSTSVQQQRSVNWPPPGIPPSGPAPCWAWVVTSERQSNLRLPCKLRRTDWNGVSARRWLTGRTGSETFSLCAFPASGSAGSPAKRSHRIAFGAGRRSLAVESGCFSLLCRRISPMVGRNPVSTEGGRPRPGRRNCGYRRGVAATAGWNLHHGRSADRFCGGGFRTAPVAADQKPHHRFRSGAGFPGQRLVRVTRPGSGAESQVGSNWTRWKSRVGRVTEGTASQPQSGRE